MGRSSWKRWKQLSNSKTYDKILLKMSTSLKLGQQNSNNLMEQQNNSSDGFNDFVAVA